MSIHVHKTGLNKTLGQQSDGIVTANLTGNWIPSTGIQTAYWENQVSGGNNLRRFNGITHNNSTPHNFQFDGTDDYLGESAEGYGGSDAFTVDVDEAYTIAYYNLLDAIGCGIFALQFPACTKLLGPVAVVKRLNSISPSGILSGKIML